MDLSACDMTKLLATISLPLLLYGLSGRWCPWYISRNVSISSCPSPICRSCRYPCCTSPL